MKNKYYLILISLIVSFKLYGQDVRFNNSFVIVINDKLVTSVEGLQLVLTDSTKKEEVITAGYYPGVIYVNNIEEKNFFYADQSRQVTLKFICYDNVGRKRLGGNYSISMAKDWFNKSLIIVKIAEKSKRRGLYKYSFDIPGLLFPVRWIENPVKKINSNEAN